MSAYLHRFSPDEFGRAERAASDAASDGTGVIHVVEVFDEQLVRNKREDVDMGPLYVVSDTKLSEFLADHEGQVQASFGVNPDELQEDR